MFKGMKADAYYHDIMEIDLAGLKAAGIKAVILDIDNTLEHYATPTPGKHTADFLQKLEEAEIKASVLSNARPERAEKFCSGLIDCWIGYAGKPGKKGYRKLAEKLGLEPREIACIGDQLYTDILGGNSFGCYTIFVEPMDVSDEPPFVRFKRLIEKPFLRRIKYDD